MVAETYNGWANYETWNVALWLQNDFNLYSIACSVDDFWDFRSYVTDGIILPCTPDGVYYDNPSLDYSRLDEMIQELA